MPGQRGRGSTYPFSPLLMNFWTSFTPRRICLCLAAARESHHEGAAPPRPVPSRPGPSRLARSLPCPGPGASRTFPDALVELARQLAGGERLGDGVQVVELLPVRALRSSLGRGRRLRLRLLLPRHGRAAARGHFRFRGTRGRGGETTSSKLFASQSATASGAARPPRRPMVSAACPPPALRAPGLPPAPQPEPPPPRLLSPRGSLPAALSRLEVGVSNTRGPALNTGLYWGAVGAGLSHECRPEHCGAASALTAWGDTGR